MINMLVALALSFYYVPSVPEFHAKYKETIDLLSCVIAGFAALMMWLAYRRINSEKWIKYFAITFIALSAIFLVPFLAPKSLTSILKGALSIVNNLFGVAAALEIQNSPLFPTKREVKSRESKGSHLLRAICWILTGLSAIAIVLMYFFPSPDQPESIATRWVPEVLLVIPDMTFSVLCLFLMGYAIFANLGSRQYRLLAPSALIIAFFYATLQIPYGLLPWISYKFQMPQNHIEAVIKLIAIPLKFSLCALAYLLVVRFFEILSKLGPMQDTEFEKRQDYLASDGIVAWIARRLSDKALSKRKTPKYSEAAGESGFVNLVIRLPGEKEKRVACIVWPNPESDKRPKILDWFPAEKKFSPLSTEVYTDRTKLWEWERFLPLVHEALTNDEKHEDIALREEVKRTYCGNLRVIVSRPIRVNGAAIGCLQIARSDSQFSQMAIRQIRQIANLLSPSVQSYRELAVLDLMSITFARKLAEESPYAPDDAVESIIVKILHDVFAPTLTRLSTDFGFSSPRVYYEIEKDVGHLKEAIEIAIAGKQFEEYRDTVSSRDFPRPYKLLKKQLTARVGPSYGHHREYKQDQFILGNLIFAVDSEEDEFNRPALGVNYLHRKTASTLASAAYLDFSRDYFSHVLKTLGKELSGKRLNFEDWFKPIQSILTKDAGFSWVVVRQRRHKTCLGDPGGLRVLERLKNKKLPVKTRQIKGSSEIRKQYYISDAEANTNHVVKLRLDGSEGVIWLGVPRPGFGPELDFPSPWKTFLVNFVQIADASLSRITLPERFKDQVEAAQLQGIIASVATTGTMVHQLSTMIASQQQSIKALRTAFAFGKIKTEETDYEDILRAMDNEATSVLQLIKSVRSLTTTDDSHPCRLVSVARHAFKLFQVSLIARDIEWEIDIEENIFVDVSFTIVALALATLVGNSKDAIKTGGKIRIAAKEEGDTVICRVEDTGHGITSDTRNIIFEPKPVTKTYGTGMGLYLTRHSLSENGSSIELTKSDESGSVFTISFPRAKEDKTQ